MTNHGNVVLQLPDDTDLLAAAGSVALAHTQLEHVLRMTIKSLANLSIREALDATNILSGKELRKRVRKLLKQRVRDEAVRTKMDALLNRAARITGRRNKLMHRPWALNTDGTPVVKDEDHHWGVPPSATDLRKLANKILQSAGELNHARLEGFLKDALASAQTA